MRKKAFSKRVIALLVAAIMVLTMAPIGLTAEGDETAGDDYVSAEASAPEVYDVADEADMGGEESLAGELEALFMSAAPAMSFVPFEELELVVVSPTEPSAARQDLVLHIPVAAIPQGAVVMDVSISWDDMIHHGDGKVGQTPCSCAGCESAIEPIVVCTPITQGSWPDRQDIALNQTQRTYFEAMPDIDRIYDLWWDATCGWAPPGDSYDGPDTGMSPNLDFPPTIGGALAGFTPAIRTNHMSAVQDVALAYAEPTSLGFWLINYMDWWFASVTPEIAARAQGLTTVPAEGYLVVTIPNVLLEQRLADYFAMVSVSFQGNGVFRNCMDAASQSVNFFDIDAANGATLSTWIFESPYENGGFTQAEVDELLGNAEDAINAAIATLLNEDGEFQFGTTVLTIEELIAAALADHAPVVSTHDLAVVTTTSPSSIVGTITLEVPEEYWAECVENGTLVMDINIDIHEITDPDEILALARQAVSDAVTILMNAAAAGEFETKEAFEEAVKVRVAQILAGFPGVEADFDTIVVAVVHGTPENPAGTDGTFTVRILLSMDGASGEPVYVNAILTTPAIPYDDTTTTNDPTTENDPPKTWVIVRVFAPAPPSVGVPNQTAGIGIDVSFGIISFVGGASTEVRIVDSHGTVEFASPAAITGIVTDSCDVAVFDLSGLNITSASIPRATVRALARADLGLEVLLPQGEIALSPEAVEVLAASAHTFNITFRITEIDEDRLPEAVLATLPAGAAVHQVSVTSGSRVFRSLGGADMSVVLPSDAASVSRLALLLDLVPVASSVSGGNVEFGTRELGLFVLR